MMIMTLRAAVTGKYQADADTSEADCIIGLAFGCRPGPGKRVLPGPVNEALAEYAMVLDAGHGLPWLLQGEIADALPKAAEKPELIIRRHTIRGQYLDTRNVLEQAYVYMALHGLHRPLILAQAHHASRVSVIARKLSLDPLLPVGLPAGFDRRSSQPWTRSRLAWSAHELYKITQLEI